MQRGGHATLRGQDRQVSLSTELGQGPGGTQAGYPVLSHLEGSGSQAPASSQLYPLATPAACPSSQDTSVRSPCAALRRSLHSPESSQHWPRASPQRSAGRAARFRGNLPPAPPPVALFNFLHGLVFSLRFRPVPMTECQFTCWIFLFPLHSDSDSRGCSIPRRF